MGTRSVEYRQGYLDGLNDKDPLFFERKGKIVAASDDPVTGEWTEKMRKDYWRGWARATDEAAMY